MVSQRQRHYFSYSFWLFLDLYIIKKENIENKSRDFERAKTSF